MFASVVKKVYLKTETDLILKIIGLHVRFDMHAFLILVKNDLIDLDFH